jgi:hypothetical protein
MSDRSFQATASSTSASPSLGGSTLSSASPSQSVERSCLCDGPECRSTGTCERWMAARLASIFSPAASLAREHPSQATERDSTILRLRSGGRWPESSAYYDPDSSSLRTLQTSSAWRDPRASLLEPRGERYLATWPRSAMCSRGIVYPLPPLAPLTFVTGCSALLPTPCSRDWKGQGYKGQLPTELRLLPTPHGMPKEGQARRPGPTGNELGRAITLLPTPTANDDNKSPEAHMRMKARMKGGPWSRMGRLRASHPTMGRSRQGPAPAPLLRGVDDRRARRVVRSRLSALGDGVHVQAGHFLGAKLMELALEMEFVHDPN